MTEIIPRIARDRKIELTADGSATLNGVDPIKPQDAAFLARALLAAATALSGNSPPPVGALVGDAHLPVVNGVIGKSNITGDPVLLLSVPPGIELTFQLSPSIATSMGESLVAAASNNTAASPPGPRRDSVH